MSKHSFELETWVKKTSYFVLIYCRFFLKWEAVLNVAFGIHFIPKLSSLMKFFFCNFLLKKPVILICLFSKSRALSENWSLVYTLRNPLVCCLNLGFITGNPTSQNFQWDTGRSNLFSLRLLWIKILQQLLSSYFVIRTHLELLVEQCLFLRFLCKHTARKRFIVASLNYSDS